MRQKHSWFSEQRTGAKILLSLFIIGLFIVTIFLFSKSSNSQRKIIQLNFVAILLGLVFEYKHISKKWSTVWWTAAGAFILSFFAFAKGKGERTYNFEDHLTLWPYVFLGIFVIIAAVIFHTSATKKLNEGITLLLTIAINYWILANNYWDTGNLFVKILIALNLVFTAFSLYHSISYKPLGKGTRLALSIWSSIITLILSFDNFLKLYQVRDIEQLSTFSESAFVFVQYFLLGVSSIYIAQNFIMIVSYFPGNQYMDTIRETNDVHLKRYSEKQVYIVDSIIVLIISLTVFTLNYFFQFLPTNFTIWATITLTPFFLYLVHKVLD